MPGHKTVGIIGGLGVGATVIYYEKIVAQCVAQGFVPKLLMSHANAPTLLAHVTAGRLGEMAAYLAELCEALTKAGAEFLVIPAITPHICIDDLRQRVTAPFVDILAMTADEIRKRKLQRIALFGTRFSTESRLFGRLDGFDVVRPRPEEVDDIHRIYLELAQKGLCTPEEEARLRELGQTLCRRDGVEAIVLAGTDLNLIFTEANAGFPALDCAQAHIDAIVERMAG